MLHRGIAIIKSSISGSAFALTGILYLSLFATSVEASSQYIVSDICVKRATEIGVFQNNKDPVYTAQALQKKYSGTRSFDFSLLDQTYQSTLKELNTQLEDDQSELLKYLMDCDHDERKCHNHFQPQNKFDVALFCDREIYTVAIQISVENIDRGVEKCSKFPRNLTAQEMEIPTYNPECFQSIIIKTSVVYENTSLNQIELKRKLLEMFQRMIRVTKKTVSKSVLPDGALFILQKNNEEMGNLSLRPMMKKMAESYYRMQDLAGELDSCCKNNKELLSQYDLSSFYARGVGSELTQNLQNKPPLLTFHTDDWASNLLMYEAESQHWKRQIQNKSPLQFSKSDQLAFFKYLQSNPFFYRDLKQNDFEELIKTIKTKPRASITPRLLTDKEFELFEKQNEEEKKKRGYQPSAFEKKYPNGMTIYSDEYLQGMNEKDAINSFLFKPGFNLIYTDYLVRQNEASTQKAFEAYKQKYYPTIIAEYLPYAFGRANDARLVRILQKLPKTTGLKILEKPENFQLWADQQTCNSSQKWSPYFCSETGKLKVNGGLKQFRYERYIKLYQKITNGNIPIAFAAGGRKYIYDDDFITDLNKKITNINNYCYSVANPKSDMGAFEAVDKKGRLDGLMDGLYSTPRFNEIQGQTGFSQFFHFDPENYKRDCYKKGVIFGWINYSPVVQKRLSTPKAIGRGGALYPTVDEATSGLSFKSAYLPATFSLLKRDMEEIENDIEKHSSDEFMDLKSAANQTGFSDIKEFLEESAGIRILSMLEYAMENPSREIGQYLCNLIDGANNSEQESIRTKELIKSVIFTGVGIATFVLLPGVGAAGTAVFYNAGTTIVLAGISIAASSYDIQQLKHKQSLIARSAANGNLMPKDVLHLQNQYDTAISSSRDQTLAAVAIYGVLGGKPIINVTKKIANTFNEAYQLERQFRLGEIENFVRITNYETPKYVFSGTFKEFLGNQNNLTTAEFKELIDALHHDNVASLIQKVNGTKYGNMLWNFVNESHPSVREGVRSALLDELSITKETVKNGTPKLGFLQPVVSGFKVIPMPTIVGKTAIYLKPYFFKIKIAMDRLSSEWETLPASMRLQKEDGFAKMLNEAQEISSHTNRTVFTEEELRAFATRFKYFVRSADGRFVSTLNEELEWALIKFRENRIITNQNAELIDKYLTPLLMDVRTLSKADWLIVATKFTRNIQSIDDCKAFLKAIKFARKEYLGFKIIANVRELASQVAYPKRTQTILENINEFYDFAKYVGHKNDVRTINAISKYLSNGKINGTMEEIDQAIRKINAGFDINEKMFRFEQAKNYVADFEGAPLYKAVTGKTKMTAYTNDGLLGKYFKQFYKQEKFRSNYFYTRFENALLKGESFENAYVNAVKRVRRLKKMEDECASPESMAKQEADGKYSVYAQSISVTSSVIGYWANHNQEEKDSEWWGRIGFDVLVPYITTNLQLTTFLRKSRSPVLKPWDSYTTSLKGMLIDAAAYSGMNNYLWDSSEKFQTEIARSVYQSENVEQTIRDFFQDHPEIEEKVTHNFQALEKISKILEQEDVEQLSRAQIRELFVKEGIIDLAFPKAHTIPGDNPIDYKEILATNGIKPDANGIIEVSDEEMNAVLADIMYEKMFKNKNSSIQFWFGDPVDLEGINVPFTGIDLGDLPEIGTGSQTWDRYIFNTSFDGVMSIPLITRSQFIRQVICKQRLLPMKAGLVSSLITHAIYKGATEPVKYYVRKQTTGH